MFLDSGSNDTYTIQLLDHNIDILDINFADIYYLATHESLALSDLLFDNVHNTRFGDGAKITKLITLTIHNFAHDATHDLITMQMVSRC